MDVLTKSHWHPFSGIRMHTQCSVSSRRSNGHRAANSPEHFTLSKFFTYTEEIVAYTQGHRRFRTAQHVGMYLRTRVEVKYTKVPISQKYATRNAYSLGAVGAARDASLVKTGVPGTVATICAS